MVTVIDIAEKIVKKIMFSEIEVKSAGKQETKLHTLDIEKSRTALGGEPALDIDHAIGFTVD